MSSFSREGHRFARLRGIWILLLLLLVRSAAAADSSETAVSCKPDEFLTEKKQGCTVIDAELTINGDVVLPASAKTIKEMKGTLNIINRKETIDFPVLAHIDSDKKPAIVIENSPKLQGLQLSSLKKFTTESKVVIRVMGSDGTQFPAHKNLEAVLTKAQMADSMRIECVPNLEFNGLARVYCNSIEGDVTFKNFRGSFVSTIDTISGCISVTDSDFSRFKFLETATLSKCTKKWVIHNSLHACWNEEQLKEQEEKYEGQQIDYIASKSCDITCESSFYKYCNHFNGNLVIKSVSDEDMAYVMQNVKAVKGQLEITENDGQDIIFEQLASVGNENLEGPAIVMNNNPNIPKLEFKVLTSVKTNGDVLIEVQNSEMTQDDRKYLWTLAFNTNKRLNFECHFGTTPVDQLNTLDYCTSIRKDLILKDPQGNADASIQKIGGCLKIENTQLEELNFLDFSNLVLQKKCIDAEGSSEIKGSSKLCFAWSTIKKLKPFIENIAASDNENCPFPCTFAEFNEDGSLCRELHGDLSIDSKSDQKKTKNIMEKIVTIKGSLQIVDPAIKEISFPKLIHIVPTTGHAVYIKAEKLSFMTADLDKTFRIASQGQIIYECATNGDIKDWSQLQWCIRIKGDLNIVTNLKGNPSSSSRIEQISGCLKIEKTNLKSIFFLNLIEKSGKDCKGNHTITDNKDLCISTHKSDSFNKLLDGKLKVSKNKEKDCPVTCDADKGTITVSGCQIVEGYIEIQKNCSDKEKFKEVTEIRGGLHISDCSLNSIKEQFPKLKKVHTTSGVALRLEKIGGDIDAKYLMQLDLESIDAYALRLETNKSVDYLDEIGLKSIFGDDKVSLTNAGSAPPGLCAFSKPPTEIKKECPKVSGDLVLDKTTKEATNLKEITGCLIMKNTNLTSYEFLVNITVGKTCMWRKTNHHISDNLCIPYKVRRLLKDKNPLKNSTNDESNSKGCYECSGSLQGNGTMCKVMLDGLTVTNETPLKDLKNVTEVYGRLVIRKTTHKQISFSSLTIIDADGAKGPAFEVTENKDLKTLELPNLKKITSKETTKVKITGNPQLEMGNLTKTLASASKETCSKDKGSACQISAESDEPEEATKAPAEEDSKTALWIGLGVSAVVVVLLAGAGGTVFFLYKKGKIFKKKKDGKEDGKGGKGGKKGGKGGKKNTKSGTKTTTKSVANSVSQEASKADAPKTDAPKTDAAKTDAAKTDDPKADAPKPEAGKPDGGKPEAGKPEGGKPEDGKPEAGKPNFGWKAQNPPEAAPASAPASGNSLPPGVPPGRNIDDALDNDEVYNQGITK